MKEGETNYKQKQKDDFFIFISEVFAITLHGLI